MTTLEIIALVVICLGAAVALTFLIIGMVEMFSDGVRLPKAKKVQEKEEEVVAEPEVEQVTEIDIDQMLARLEARKEEAENAAEEEVVEAENEAAGEEVVVEVVEEPVEEMIVEEPAAEEEVVEVIEEPAEEEVVEEPVEEVVEEAAPEVEPVVIIKEIPAEEVDKFDYKTRLEKIKESQDKIEKDLEKTQKAINKYERTERRRARNQKLLDRKATELTNLNLVMYSVTDIKNVDSEKKAKQEELTAHIAELKASIQDAEEDLAKNESKYQNNVKLLSYLTSEKHRYEEEVKEIEKMLAKAGK